MAALVDTNVLVYSFDSRFPKKQERAIELLRAGVANDSIRLPHQAVIEFMAAVTRPLPRYGPILPIDDARREAEELLSQFTVLYPTEQLVRTALRGMAAYGLSWYDAHLWAYADQFGLEQLWSEDFQHDRLYGTVRVINPFVDALASRSASSAARGEGTRQALRRTPRRANDRSLWRTSSRRE